MDTTVPTHHPCIRCGTTLPHYCPSPARLDAADVQAFADAMVDDPGPLPVDVDLPTVDTVLDEKLRFALRWVLGIRELDWATDQVPAAAMTAVAREIVRATVAFDVTR